MPQYNPYSAAAKIVENKAGWHNAVSQGKSGDAYAKAASQYYGILRSAGYSDIADTLENSDYEQANKYLKELDGIYNKEEAKAYSVYDGLVSSKSDEEKYRTEVDSARNEQNLRYLSVLSELEKGYGESDTGKAVLERYRQLGERSAAGAAASAAADNGGNTDSYAAANAARQRVAYADAGEAAASEAFSDSISAKLKTLQYLYSDSDSADSAIADSLTRSQAADKSVLANYGAYTTERVIKEDQLEKEAQEKSVETAALEMLKDLMPKLFFSRNG